MLRLLHAAAPVALLVASAPAQSPDALLRPVTSNVHARTVRADPSTGRVQHVPAALGGGGLATVFDNTCPEGYFNALHTQAQNGPGSTGPMAAGDWGAVPSTAFTGSATCSPGCADAYDITQFTFSYCSTDGVPVDLVLHFWDRFATGGTGLFACDSVQLIGETVPPVFPRATYAASPTGMADITLVGLPRSTAGAGVPHGSACYAITVQLDAPGFRLNGGANGLTNLSTMGDRFAWSMQVTNGSGGTGPLLAGNALLGSSCTFCAGTIWEPGGQTTNPGIGLGQSDHLWLDTYGGTTPLTGNCYFGGLPWRGMDLVLKSIDPCAGSPFTLCDASDGSLASCPCGNAGAPNAGCDNAQGTGGVALDVLAQTTAPNGATLVGTGFPAMSNPTAIVLRSDMLDPNAPVVFGDGVRCIGPTPLVRLAAVAASGGVSTHAFGHGAMASGGAFYYQLWYRSTPSTFCDPLAAFNLSNGVVLNW